MDSSFKEDDSTRKVVLNFWIISADNGFGK